MTGAFFTALYEQKTQLKYVAFDPGKTTGIAAWAADEDMPAIMGLEVDEAGLDVFFEYVESQETPPSHFIYEEYRVFNDSFNHQGKSILTEQVIGSIRHVARRIGAEVVKQRPDQLRTGLTWAGVDIPRGHTPDWLSAYGHGYFYLYNNGIIKRSRVLQERPVLGAQIVQEQD